MSRTLVLLVLLLCSAFTTAHATSHVFVRNRDGVWIASDSFMLHRHDSGGALPESVCKVILKNGEILFNAGAFRDIRELESDEARIPFATPAVTLDSMMDLMKRNHQDLPPSRQMLQFAGLIQVTNGQFLAGKLSLATDLTHYQIGVFPLKEGVPHGVGRKEVEEAHARARQDPSYAEQVATNPKQELITILNAEFRDDPQGGVRPPFTVFLLRPDGSIVDYSDEHLCEYPDGVRITRAQPDH